MPFTLMLVLIVLPFLVRFANTQLSISKLGGTSPRYDLLPVPLLPVFLNIGIFCVSCSRNSNTPSKYIALLMPRLGIGEIGHFLVTFLCNSTAGQLAVFCSITVSMAFSTCWCSRIFVFLPLVTFLEFLVGFLWEYRKRPIVRRSNFVAK